MSEASLKNAGIIKKINNRGKWNNIPNFFVPLRHNLKQNEYELHRNGTTGTAERCRQRHLAGRP